MAFSPDGKTLATAGNDGTVRLWDVATRAQIGAPFGSGVRTVAFSPDGKTLATAGNDDTARLWDVATHHQIGPPLRQQGSVSRWPSAPTARPWPPEATTGRSGCGTWPPTPSRRADPSGTDVVHAVAFSPDGKTLATAGNDGTVRLWDVATHAQIGAPFGQRRERGGLQPRRQDPRHRGPRRHGAAVGRRHPAQSGRRSAPEVSAVAFSPDGKTLATAGPDGTRLWAQSPPQTTS